MSAELQLILEKMNGLGSDMQELKSDMQELRAEFKSDMQELRTELKSDIEGLRVEVKSDMNQMQAALEMKIDHILIEMRGQFKYTENRLNEHTKILQIVSNRLNTAGPTIN
ncbi:MAG: hypothetical protein ACI4XS_09795 [Bacillus sp. (in: firmicutes)]